MTVKKERRQNRPRAAVKLKTGFDFQVLGYSEGRRSCALLSLDLGQEPKDLVGAAGSTS